MMLSKLLTFATWSQVLVHGYLQEDTRAFVNDFPKYEERAYTAIDNDAPSALRDACENRPANQEGTQVVVSSVGSSVISSKQVQTQCGTSNTCIIEGLTMEMDSSLVVHALVVRNEGKVSWTDATQYSNDNLWLCAGYVAIENGGTFIMNLQEDKKGWIYISNNGAIHNNLRSRAFGAVGASTTINIKGRIINRPWSLLSTPLNPGETFISLRNDPIGMGWRVGDRIAIAPTDDLAKGDAQAFAITELHNDGRVGIDQPSLHLHQAITIKGPTGNFHEAAEVINLSRNIVITGDNFQEIRCDPTLTETFPGFGTSTEGCMCSSFRDTCTVGLHVVHMFGGVSQIENVRIEKCGQRGIEGKYCLHLHLLKDCPNCLLRNNAVEFSQHRGLTIHGTHNSKSEYNVFYDVRGASMYIEDGNEIFNTLSYNVAICPWKFSEKGCTLPGTSNGQGDTELNQAGIYLQSPTNNLFGNRMANHFNGMFLNPSNGRGLAQGKVCGPNMPLGRWEGNMYHSNGRFGTYLLNGNFPLQNTGVSIDTNGETSICQTFTDDGIDNGMLSVMSNNFDYGNAFVGHYEAGDIQYNGHTSFQNLNLIYWKETKSFADGCSAHIANSYFLEGTMALPDSFGSFIIEHTTLEDVLMEANHHCGVGITGYLCMPHYVLHDVNWVDHERSNWVVWTQSNEADSGGIFSLSPNDAALNAAGDGGYFLPQSYQSLVSGKYSYLLRSGACDTAASLNMSVRYSDGILCKVPLRPMKIYSTRNLGEILLQMWPTASKMGEPVAEQRISYFQSNEHVQGYKFPLISGRDFFYQISLNGNDIPSDWIIDFSDQSVTNRWGVDEVNIEIQGRDCRGLIRSDHDRRFIGSDVKTMFIEGKGWGHGACTSHSPTPVKSCRNGRQSPPKTQSTSTPVSPPSSVTIDPPIRVPDDSPNFTSSVNIIPTTASSMTDGFKLVYAPNNTVMMDLVDGTIVYAGDFPEKSFNVQLVLMDQLVQSVSFVENGRIELTEPFSYCGDFGVISFDCPDLLPGPHDITVTAIPHLSSEHGRNALPPMSVTFKIAPGRSISTQNLHSPANATHYFVDAGTDTDHPIYWYASSNRVYTSDHKIADAGVYPESIFQTHRYGKWFKYVFDVLEPNSTNQITLGFAETYAPNCDDDNSDELRVFNVAVNGHEFLNNYTILEHVPCYTAHYLDGIYTADAFGSVEIIFSSATTKPESFVSSIEITTLFR